MMISTQDIQKLPVTYQEELFDFLQYLLDKLEREKQRQQEDEDWLALSLASAMRDIEQEEEVVYTLTDIKVSFL